MPGGEHGIWWIYWDFLPPKNKTGLIYTYIYIHTYIYMHTLYLYIIYIFIFIYLRIRDVDVCVSNNVRFCWICFTSFFWQTTQGEISKNQWEPGLPALNIPESSKFNLILCCVRTTDWIQLATVVTRFVVKALFLLVEAKILMIKAQCLQVAYFGWYFGWISLSTSHSWLLKWYCFNSWFCWLNSHWICSIGLMSHVSW